MDGQIGELMGTAMDKLRVMVDASTVVGEPLVTPDEVTLIPVSRVSFGYASGGSDTSENTQKPGIWAGSGAAVKVDPVGFLMIKEGGARMVCVQPPAFTTADRVIDLIPELIERAERYIAKQEKKSRS